MTQNKIVIGLIGGSGVGKGVFSAAAAELGFTIIDGDKIGHSVLQNEAYDELVNEFGNGITENGNISRKKLGAIVFNDATALQRLDNIVHVHITNKIRGLMTDRCVIDAAVLHKTELINECTHIITVVADKEIRIKRIISRDGISEQAALSRINSQISDADYARLSDIVLENNGTDIEFIKKVKECLQGL